MKEEVHEEEGVVKSWWMAMYIVIALISVAIGFYVLAGEPPEGVRSI